MSQFTPRMLTVRQPWADFLVPSRDLILWLTTHNPDLIPQLPKDVENRPYGTTWRGTLLIHAGQQADRKAMDMFGLDQALFVRGAVVGTVQLVDITTTSASPWALPGSRHWQVTNRQRLSSPVECTGFLGLRPPTPPVLASVLSLLDHQRKQLAIR